MGLGQPPIQGDPPTRDSLRDIEGLVNHQPLAWAYSPSIIAFPWNIYGRWSDDMPSPLRHWVFVSRQLGVTRG